jgi:hypothetical protein
MPLYLILCLTLLFLRKTDPSHSLILSHPHLNLNLILRRPIYPIIIKIRVSPNLLLSIHVPLSIHPPSLPIKLSLYLPPLLSLVHLHLPLSLVIRAPLIVDHLFPLSLLIKTLSLLILTLSTLPQLVPQPRLSPLHLLVVLLLLPLSRVSLIILTLSPH